MDSDMTCANLNMNMNLSEYGPITSTSQIVNVASKIDLVPVLGQSLYMFPRISGAGKDLIQYVAHDFDDTMEFGT